MHRTASALIRGSVLAAIFLGCARNSSGTPPGDANPSASWSAAHSGAPLGSGSADPVASSASGLSRGASSWVGAVRLERWRDAARLIDGLDAKQQAEPGLRYVRARAAIAMGEHARAVHLLDGLAQKLPTLAADIARYRAEAQLEAGPYVEAAKYFASRSTVSAITKAALAYERAGKLARARGTADYAIRLAQRKKLRDEQALARAIRARTAIQQKKQTIAIADLRWLATSVPAHEHAQGADSRLAELSPHHALTKAERYARAMSFAELGRVEEMERELELLDGAPGPKVRRGELLHARAWARYQARQDYETASKLFSEAARVGSRDVVQDGFYAARALSRAHQDEKAIDLYRRLARQHPRSGYAEHATFRAARLEYLLGKWTPAIQSYTAYLKRFGKRALHRESVAYDTAVARLAGGQHRQAASAFAVLAQGEQRTLERSFYRHLQGVALAGAGDKKTAAEKFRQVIEEYPLSFPALVSAARLTELGEQPPPPIEPAQSAPAPAQLKIKLPDKVELLLRLGLDLDAERELGGYEQTLRATHGARGNEAVCQAYAGVSGAARRYRAGQQAASWQHLRQAPSAATRWLWDCIYPRPYLEAVRAAEQRYELPPHLVYAVMRQESTFRPTVVSPARAVGLMQLIPPTARRVADELSVEYRPELLRSPAENIRLGAHYLSKVLAMFGGLVPLGAAAYNAGPSAVSRWLETGESLPLDIFVARIPYGETRKYVLRVTGNLARYTYLYDGPEALPRLQLALPRGLRAPGDAY